jgi:hypothetical protein
MVVEQATTATSPLPPNVPVKYTHELMVTLPDAGKVTALYNCPENAEPPRIFAE